MNSKTLTLGIVALIGFLLCFQQIRSSHSTNGAGVEEARLFANASAADIKWMSWEEAVAANKANPKKIVVDVYTDWCGWCKRMDATTFKDPKVAAYIADHFYAVKFDAEQQQDITYDGHTFSFQRSGKRGVHALAASLLDNRLSYPSVVYLNDNMERIMISPGYKDADKMLQELKYANGETKAP